MSSAIIDISVSVHPRVVRWPSSPEVIVEKWKSIERGDAVNASRLSMDVHAGTHVDAPLHFLPDGDSVDSLPLEAMVGRATVVDATAAERLDASTLDALDIPIACSRVLFKTSNSKLWERPRFTEDYVALTSDGSQWLRDREVKLVGVDYLSVQRYEDGPAVHLDLLGRSVVLLEGLTLAHVPAGEYELVCLPLKIQGAEAAPARAVLRIGARDAG